ncbi:hypothetical protein [Oceanivirga miroungae]|uniref:Uncharacterized protein n=1 Tax=Oceanivirga miroungae TaxID=1130046 RepID=A0A6I8M6P3_9FUSO|nr:hypothetical protein [Oceanivirga miroungae]VWL85055.1 hypothetical protein OMES3154_00331 [Oceanivirga miroungae]
MIMSNKKIDVLVLILFITMLLVKELSLFVNISLNFLIYITVILSLLRAIYFLKFLKINFTSSSLVLVCFLMYGILHSSNYYSDLTLDKYFVVFTLLNLINILNFIYGLFTVNSKYIVILTIYIVISILMTIEYIPYICYSLEILASLIFLVIYEFTNRKED